MNIDNEEKSENIEIINSQLILEKNIDNSKQSKNRILSSPNNIKKENKKRNRKKKNEKAKNSKNNISTGILSEIKQITIPDILSEKENLFKILQIEIINIDKGISLLNKKKKYYNEIIHKLNNEIQNEKKNIKKNEIKNKEYLFMENIVKDYDINDCFENITIDNSYYNMSKKINESLDFEHFLNNNYKTFLVINNFNKNISSQINNKMEPNNQLTYEEFNNISEIDNNFCLLMNNLENNFNINNGINEKKDDDLQILNVDNKIEGDEKKINDSEDNNQESNIDEYKPEKDEFDIIDEAPPEEEDTNNKMNKRNSIKSDKKELIENDCDNENKIKNLDIDKIINKNYSSNFEELDFYLFKDSINNETKENNKKKKITFEDIQKKYKTQNIGSGFESIEKDNNDSPKKEEENIKKKKKKNKKIKSKTNIEESSLDCSDNKNENFTYSSEISKDESDDNNNSGKKKKRRRKNKNNNINIFSMKEEFPEPENLDSVALALEMKKYGMKPQNKKRNIEILKSVYKFLKIKELPEFISRKLATFDLDNDENFESENDGNITSKKEDNTYMTELSDEQKRNIIDILKENKIIYEKILLFKEISLKEIKTLLNSKGIILPNKLLSQLLINSGAVLPGGWNDKK